MHVFSFPVVYTMHMPFLSVTWIHWVDVFNNTWDFWTLTKLVACVSNFYIGAGLSTATHWSNQCVKNACGILFQIRIQRRSFGGGSIMVWGGITEHDKTPLVVFAGNLTGMRYRDGIVQRYVKSCLLNLKWRLHYASLAAWCIGANLYGLLDIVAWWDDHEFYFGLF
jgi:hypothetical protein